MHMRLLPSALGALVIALTPHVAASQAARWISPPVEMRVPKPPTVAPANGGAALAYELHLTNWFAQPFSVQRVEVLNGADGRVLSTLADSTLARSLGRPGMTPTNPGDRTRIGGGMRGVAWLWVPVDAQNAPPAVRHRVTVQEVSGADSGRTHVFEGATVAVSRDIVAIGPPLRGGAWLTANGRARVRAPAGRSSDRSMPVIAQRFAIDYVRVDTSGRTVNGDTGQQRELLRGECRRNRRRRRNRRGNQGQHPREHSGPTSRAVPITLETVGGNSSFSTSALVRTLSTRTCGQARCACAPESIPTRPVLGLVGNSGNSTEPHLHVHIADANSPLGSEGIPYVQSRSKSSARAHGILSGCSRSATPQRRQREMPLANMIIRFPE